MVIIPQDIIDSVIEAVGDDTRLLKKCALVSSSFLLPSRKLLFSNIYVRSDQACQRLHQFFVENPVVQSFVRSINISLADYENPKSYLQLNCTSLIAILRLTFCCLESFSVGMPFNWNNFASELKDALSTIIHSSTLKTLYLEKETFSLEKVNVPIMLFHGTHLTKLELSSLSPNDFDDEQSRLLTSAASYPVIDHCIWSFDEPAHGPTEPLFIPFMCRLQVFEINVNPFSATMSDFDILSLLMHSLRVSLTTPATLQHIKFNIVFDGNDNDFNYYTFFDDLRDADVWSHLDSIITHPTGSRLQRVDINIKYSFRYDDDVEEPDNTGILKTVLDALPLLHEKGILFVEASVSR